MKHACSPGPDTDAYQAPMMSDFINIIKNISLPFYE